MNGEKERFPLPACEEIEVNLVNAFRRRKMEYTIGVEDDSLLEVSVHSSEMALGSYALEVKGKLFGSSWRSNEYEQIMLVDNNASGDTEFGETDEGEDSVEMDTALVVLAPVIVIDGDIEVIKDEIANGVRDGAWLPVKAGRDADGNVVKGAVAEGYKTIASGAASHAEGAITTASGVRAHAEGRKTIASGEDSHAEGNETIASGRWSHTEGSGTLATSWFSHAEGVCTKALALSSHAEGSYTIASGSDSHAQGCCNYDDASFIDMVGVGRDYPGSARMNAVVVYVGRYDAGDINPTDPKNGYQYLLDVGGYKGQAVENGMKSVQEVFADHDSRIAAVEKGGSVKKSKPKIEYVVGRAIKCSLLTCSWNDRVRYVVPLHNKVISLSVGNNTRSLLAKKGDSIKVKIVDKNGKDVHFGEYLIDNDSYDVIIDVESKICTIQAKDILVPLFRIPLALSFDVSCAAWHVEDVTLGDNGVYVVTLNYSLMPSAIDTTSPYRKFENGMVVNKRLPHDVVFNPNGFVDIDGNFGKLFCYRKMFCKTKYISELGRVKVFKVRKRKAHIGIFNIAFKHRNEKKSCFMQTWDCIFNYNKIKRLN